MGFSIIGGGGGGGGATNLQGAYDGGSDILVAANNPFQIRDNGVALGNSNIFSGFYTDISSAGAGFVMVNDGSLGIPGVAGGQQVLLDTAVTFPAADQIEFGVDLRTTGGGIISPAAAVGAGSNIINGTVVNLKSTDISPTDEGEYTIVGFANGTTTNSIAIVVDSATNLPPTFTATSGTAKIFKQTLGLNGVSSGGGSQHSILGIDQGDGTSSVFGLFSDGGNYSSIQSLFNIGTLTESVLNVVNAAPLFGASANVPFLTFNTLGATVDNVDIVPAVRFSDPTATVTFGPSTSISFQDNAPNPDTITVSGGGLLGAGFRNNTDVVVSGSASNDGQYRIQGLTDTVITLSPSDSLTPEGAGASVTLTDRLLAPGGLFYNASEGSWKYWDNITVSLQPLGGSLQTAYNGGNNIDISSKPFAVHVGGNGYSRANASTFIVDTMNQPGAGLASTIFKVLGGSGAGAPYHQEYQRSTEDETVSFIAGGALVSGATDISFNAAANPNEINSVTTDFVAAGFVPGDYVAVTGSLANNTNYKISAVATNTLTLTSADSVTGEGAGLAITLTTFDKVVFPNTINFLTATNQLSVKGINAIAFDYSVVSIQNSDVAVDSGDHYIVRNIGSSGGGTNNMVAVSTLQDTNPGFTSTTADGYAYVLDRSYSHTQSQFACTARTSAVNFHHIYQDGGSCVDLATVSNFSGSITTSLMLLSNQETDGSADVPLITFSNSADASDFRWTIRSADPTAPSLGDMWFNVTGTDRIKVETSTGTESLAYVSEVVTATDKGTTTRATGGNQVITHSLGKAPKMISIQAIDTLAPAIISHGSYDGNNACIFVDGASAVGQSAQVVQITNGANSLLGTVSAVSATDFTINWSAAGAGRNVTFIWEAIS